MSLPIGIIVIAALLVAAAVAAPATRAVLLQLLKQRSFIAGAIVLIISSLTLNTVANWLQVHFKKESAPLAVRSLADPTEGIPARLGDWLQVSTDQPIDPELEAQLKTKEYIFRDYVDTRVIGPDETKMLQSESELDREKHLAQLQSTYPPQSFIRVGVTFNTGLVDTVTHVPENCYVASGFQPTNWDVKQATCGAYSDGKPREVDYRYIQFEDQTGKGRTGCRVGYLFHVDGEYESSPLGVRRRLQNLFERYGYYAKVEMMTTEALHAGQSADASQNESDTVAAMNDFLTALLPQLERCLPDWKKLHHQA